MRTSAYLAALAVSLVVPSAQGQFSSDIPGVPRASISNSGGTQGRTAFTLTGFKVPGSTAGAGDTIAGGLRVSWGQSYRVKSEFEIGFDVTVFDAYGLQPPAPTGTTTKTFRNETYMRAVTLYDVRVGAKYRPVSALDIDGNGYELALGVGYQPSFKPLWGIEKQGDSTRSGGQFSSKTTTPTTVARAFTQNPFAAVNQNLMLAGMGSYRAKRFMGDLAIMSETVSERAVTEDQSPTAPYKGVSIRAGGSFRLTPGFAVGGAYWGDGSPPWYDEITVARPGKLKKENYAVLLQFGSDPESGLDLMISSPTGKYSESLRLYFRSRSTH